MKMCDKQSSTSSLCVESVLMLIAAPRCSASSASFYLTRVMYCLCDVVNEKLSRDCKSSVNLCLYLFEKQETFPFCGNLIFVQMNFCFDISLGL